MKVICHYSEIGIKKGKRSFFEKKLISNIRSILPDKSFSSIKKVSGRVVVNLKDEADTKDLKERLKKVFGIGYFVFCEEVDSDIDKIKKKAIELMRDKKGSFRVTTKRSFKFFPLNSQQISQEVGGFIFQNLNLEVDLKNFENQLFIEVTDSGSFLYFDKILGYGGLPVSSSGKGILLLSGGIDSPVAGFKMMKRGLHMDFIHFHAYPLVSNDSIKKAEKLFSVLKKYSPRSKLFLIPFVEIQKKIRLEIPEGLRIIFYRRMMLNIAEKVAQSQNAQTLVTGESLGQVSSQTLSNIAVTEKATDMLIFRPLIGENKEEIIKLARKIETYDISILPDQDCCTLFNPRNPRTNSDIDEVIKLEKKLDIENLKGDCLKNKRVLT